MSSSNHSQTNVLPAGYVAVGDAHLAGFSADGSVVDAQFLTLWCSLVKSFLMSTFIIIVPFPLVSLRPRHAVPAGS